MALCKLNTNPERVNYLLKKWLYLLKKMFTVAGRAEGGEAEILRVIFCSLPVSVVLFSLRHLPPHPLPQTHMHVHIGSGRSFLAWTTSAGHAGKILPIGRCPPGPGLGGHCWITATPAGVPQGPRPPERVTPQACFFPSLGLSCGSQNSVRTVFSFNFQEDDGYEDE